MPEPVIVVTPSVPPAEPNKGQPPAADPGKKESEKQYVAVEDYEKLVERVNSQSAIIEKLRKEPAKKDDPVKPPDTLTDRVKALEVRDEKLLVRETKLKEREIRSKLKSALVEGGVDPKHADRFAKLLHVEQSDKIQVDDELNVTYAESADKSVPLTEWVPAYLQTDEGKALMPPKRNPTSDGLNGSEASTPGVRYVSREDMAAGRVSTADVLAGKVQVK